MKKLIKIVLCIVLTICLLIVGGILFFRSQIQTKNYPDNTEFVIEQGMYGRSVFDKLEEENIIRNSDLAYTYMRFLSSTKMDFKAGTFLLPAHMNMDELVYYLSDDSKFYRPTSTITITEGMFLIEIAQELSNVLDVSKDDLLDYWNNDEVCRNYMNEYPFLTEDIFNENIRYNLEGYLFPSTYEFYNDSSLDEITRKFLDGTLNVYLKYEDDFVNAPSYYHFYEKDDHPATIHEIFTLASILEWESGNDEDMLDISSVFYNRLNDKEFDMLRSSVTACYSHGFDKSTCLLVDDYLSLAYTEDDETYNTYTKFDLPIGPVSSPGESAIYAALHPNDTNYYYFVGDLCGIDGKTHFSTKQEGNDTIVRKYVSCTLK